MGMLLMTVMSMVSEVMVSYRSCGVCGVVCVCGGVWCHVWCHVMCVSCDVWCGVVWCHVVWCDVCVWCVV
jgi:hypothetical protein